MIDQEDHRVRRCPRLGHEVTFLYCRTQEGATICPKIFDCWWEIFDVTTFLRENLAQEDWEALHHRKPQDKVIGLLELIRRAQEAGAAESAKPEDPPAGPEREARDFRGQA